MHHGEFNDPMLVAVYDALFPWSVEDELFLALANERPASDVLDLGCGTGRLTLALADAGHRVSGVEPAAASLEVARAKPDAGRVTWREGKADALPDNAYDLALMTSHVAQFILGDEEWSATLAHLRRSLRQGGRLVFDSRDPAARGWEAWNPAASRRRAKLPDGRSVEQWTAVTRHSGPLVTFALHYRFEGDPGERLAWATLRFRSEPELRGSLEAAGFGVREVFGGWQREPVGQGAGEFIVVAEAR